MSQSIIKIKSTASKIIAEMLILIDAALSCGGLLKLELIWRAPLNGDKSGRLFKDHLLAPGFAFHYTSKRRTQHLHGVSWDFGCERIIICLSLRSKHFAYFLCHTYSSFNIISVLVSRHSVRQRGRRWTQTKEKSST